QEYQGTTRTGGPGHPVPKYGLGISQKLNEDLRVLTKIPTVLTFSGGLVAYPTDSLYVYNITLADMTLVKPVEWDEAAILLKSVIKPPTVQYPVYYSLGT